MTKLIDRQEVIENIENCLDKYGYVDTRKFTGYMRKIFAMPYKTEEQIRIDAIDEFVELINTMPTYENEYGEIMPMPIEIMAEQLKEQKNEIWTRR